MTKPLVPFNIKLLHLTPQKLRGIGQVRSLEFFDTVTGEFHDEGLFSITMFGPVGDKRRKRNFAYLDVKLPVFHPLIFKSIINLRRFYGDILSGTRYAVWNEDAMDFDESTQMEGQTGYTFFLQHWARIQYRETQSPVRMDRIRLIEEYKDIALTDKIVVLPAGLRDLEVTVDGRPTADEINDYYQKLLRIANTIPEAVVRSNPEIMDTARYRAQLVFNELYDYLEALIAGKRKLYMGGFASRKVQNGTRNVISALIPSPTDLDDPRSISPNDSIYGLYQTMVMIRPVTYYRLKNGVMSKVFISPDTPARLIDPKSLQQSNVTVPGEDFDNWMTDEGLTRTLSHFKNPDIRHDPVMIAGHYPALVYTGPAPGSLAMAKPEEVFKVFYDIRELPSHFDRKYVRPITFAELLYITLYPVTSQFPTFTTRYPVSDVGSIYPSFIYLKSTVTSVYRLPLDDAWQPITQVVTGDDATKPALEYPVLGGVFYDTATPHITRLAGMGGDYDGDMTSSTALYAKESRESIRNFLKSRQAYIGTDGKFKVSLSLPPVELLLANLTGKVNP